MLGFAIALSLAIKQPGPEPFPYGYRCTLSLDADGFAGSVWRDFMNDQPDDFYIIQVERMRGDGEGGPLAIWSIDQRPPAPPKRYGWQVGRQEREVFAGGPDGFSLNLPAADLGTGGVWLHWWGDGEFAGTTHAITARQARSYARRQYRSIGAYLNDRAVLSRLADARRWTVAATDATGRVLYRKITSMPRAAAVKAAFLAAKARLLAARDRFVATEGRDGGAACEEHLPPDAEI